MIRFLRFLNNYFIEHSYRNPLTNKPLMTKNYYVDLGIKTSKKYEIVDEFETKSNFKINREWMHKLALLTQVVKKDNEICYAHGRILYSCLREKINQSDNLKNINIFETGTARGFSSLCMAKALHDSNISGKIITLDQLPHTYPIYWNNLSDHLDGKLSRKEMLKD